MIPQFKQYLQLSSFLRPQVGQILLISSSLATEKTEWQFVTELVQSERNLERYWTLDHTLFLRHNLLVGKSIAGECELYRGSKWWLTGDSDKLSASISPAYSFLAPTFVLVKPINLASNIITF